MCGFLLYIIGFGAVAKRLFLVGVKNFVLRQITIMIGRILEELSLIMTLEKWHKSLFTCDMLLILVILITYHFFRCDLYNHVRCKLGSFIL